MQATPWPPSHWLSHWHPHHNSFLGKDRGREEWEPRDTDRKQDERGGEQRSKEEKAVGRIERGREGAGEEERGGVHGALLSLWV